MPPRLYDDLAHLWPLLSPPEDYAAEAVAVMDLVEPYLPKATTEGRKPTLVEFGAGGGHTLVYLQEMFDCTAVDLSEAMLANCRALVPDAETIVGDMRSVRLGRKFDAVLIHDAIDYMTTPVDVLAALTTAEEHLAETGVCVVAPTYVSDRYEPGTYETDQALVDDTRVTYLSYVWRRPERPDRIDLHLTLVVDDGEKVEVVHDLHECGLFSVEQWRSWLRDAGMRAVVGPSGGDTASHDDGGAAWHGFVARHRTHERV